MTQDIKILSTPELVALYNGTFTKTVKVGTYTRGKMIADLLAAAGSEPKAPVADFGDMTGGYYPKPTGAEPPAEEPDPWGVAKEVELKDMEPLYPTEVDGFDWTAMLDENRCPLCGGAETAQTSAGEEGSFLGACNTCTACGKTYSCITGVEVEVTKLSGKKRKILNPQTKINAKNDALIKVGLSQSYDRVTRLWTISEDATGKLLSITSPNYASKNPADLLAFARGFLAE